MARATGNLAAMLLALSAIAFDVGAAAKAETVMRSEQHPTETVLRRVIDELQRGQPDYSRMSRVLRDTMQQQMSAVANLFAQLGPLQNVEFVASRASADVYKVTFTRGVTQWVIGLAADGTIEALSFRPDTSAAAPETVGEDVSTAGMSGTLVKPAGIVRPPVVLLIAGSGPTDRNGNQFGSGLGYLRQLAEQLAQRNIASLRYDKRGIGRSVSGPVREDELSMQTSVDDAAAWAGWLERRGDLGARILVGHSEGGIVAILLAQRTPVSALVLLATPGRRLGDVLRDQLPALGMPQPLMDEAATTLMALERGETVANVSPPLLPLFRPSVQPFLRSLLVIDPAEQVKSVAVPVLMVSGGRDTQVRAVDAEALAKARPDAVQLRIAAMNHVLQVPGERTDAALAPELVEAIAAFVARLPNTAGRVRQ